MEIKAEHLRHRPFSCLRDSLVNQELLPKNEYLLAENRILKAHLQPGFRPSRPKRTTLAEIGKRVGRKLLEQVASLQLHNQRIAGGRRSGAILPA